MTKYALKSERRTKSFAVVQVFTLIVGSLLILRPVPSETTARAGGHAAAAVHVVNTTVDAPDANLNDPLCLDSLARCTLRAAIQQSNFNVGTLDSIDFAIPGAGTRTIIPSTPLPTIDDPVKINGYSQQPCDPINPAPPCSQPNTLAAGSNAVLLIELRGSSNFTGNALTISAGNSTVRGLVINTVFDSSACGIKLEGSGDNHIEGNFIGTNVAGTTGVFIPAGVVINGSPNNVIGGTTPDTRNLISGTQFNGAGITISGIGATGNAVQGNLIGTQKDGTSPLGNPRVGVEILDVSTNTIGGIAGITVGGPCTGACNVIAFNGLGFGGTGVAVSGSSAAGNAIQGNSIFDNGGIGIDLGSDGITPHDAGDADTGPNNLQNYPTLTYNSGAQVVQVAFNSTATTNFDIDFYSNVAADPSGNGEGQTYLHRRNVTTDGSGNANFDITFPVSVPVGQFITATATRTAAPPDTSEFSNAIEITGSPTAADAIISGTITDNNGAPVAGTLINLDGAQSRKTITNANGYYLFDNVQATGFYTVTPSRTNYSFNPLSRSFSQLGNHTDAAFTALWSGDFVNPLDTSEYFVRQHYLDFLGREPDEAGFNFWSDQIRECGVDGGCTERRRINVSAAYFLSIEFQETGGLVDSLYRVSYGARPQFVEFMPDTREVARDVIVGAEGWQAKLEANRKAFVQAFVQRQEFINAYGNMSNDVFVDTLISHTGVSFTAGERDALVSGLVNGTLPRSAVLRSIAENTRFVNAKFNEAFVMMQYFGYLRRDPDESGYQFWLNKLNQFNGNFEQAEMVKAFIISGEYRQRFAR